MSGFEIPLMIAGAAVSFIGSMRQASATKQLGQQQAVAERQAAEYNADVSERNAEITRNNARVDARRVEREMRIKKGQVAAAGSGSGLQLMGSALDVMEDNFFEGELDRLTILHEGEIRAQNFERDAEFTRFSGQTKAQSAIYRSKTEASSIRTGAVGGLLGTGAKVASKTNFGSPSSSLVVSNVGGSFD